MTEERRAPVQGDGQWWVDAPRMPSKAPGTVVWHEHVEAWKVYRARNGKAQDAERIAERGGFGYFELTELLGHEPATWKART